MAGQLRHEIVQKSSDSTNHSRKTRLRKHITFKIILYLVLYSLIILIPFILGYRTIIGNVGMFATEDRFSRVDFQWQVPDSAAIFKEVEGTHLPIYERVPRSKWMNQVFEPIAMLLESAVDFRNADKLLKYAQDQNIEINKEEANVLTNYLLSDVDQGIYSELINPARRAVDQWVYSRGMLNDERYKIEISKKDNDKEIEVIRPENRFTRGSILTVGSDTGPVGSKEIAELLEKGMYDKLWLVRHSLRNTLENIIQRRVIKYPTLIYQEELTVETLKHRKKLALKRASHISKGEKIISKGQKITSEIYGKLRAENEAFNKERGTVFNVEKITGKFILVFMSCLIFIILTNRYTSWQVIKGTALCGLICILLAYIILFNGQAIIFLPIGFLSGCISLGSNRNIGMLATLCFCLLFLSISSEQAAELLAILGSGCFFAIQAPKARFRMGLLKTCLVSAFIAILIYIAWNLSDGQQIIFPEDIKSFYYMRSNDSINSILVTALKIIVSWIISFLLVILCLKPIQTVFNATTNIRLQDLQEHPLQHNLLLKAPSTYYHSSVAAALSEAAAEACGANGLLCRTSCLYHDIGKLVKPEYFTENESGISRHDSLTASMSSLIIISHVKDGVEMGRQWHLPPAIIDIIEQHHGTTTVTYFLRQALEEANSPEEIDEMQFRYPGPRPEFPEAAIVMIADSVEAASRSLDNASNASIRALVHNIILGKLEDRQFDNCGLVFSDLADIEDAIVKVLQSMFHSRIKYDQKNSRKKR